MAPRLLLGEPRLCRHDEQDIVDRANHQQKLERYDRAQETLARMVRDLHDVRSLIVGDVRGYVREIEHGLHGLERSLGKP